MSKLSLSETNWINLVFEYKNKGYGAYQLRHESAKLSYFRFSWVSYYVLSFEFSQDCKSD
jgi:hypothetical protein